MEVLMHNPLWYYLLIDQSIFCGYFQGVAFNKCPSASGDVFFRYTLSNCRRSLNQRDR